MTSITSTGAATTTPSTASLNISASSPSPPSIPPQASASASTSAAPAPAHTPSTSATKGSSASSPFPARSLSYAQASKTTTIVSSSVALPAQHSAVTPPSGSTAAAAATNNARIPVSAPSPVNGKHSIQPAVPPLVATPPAASSSGNVIVNGSSSVAGPPSHGHSHGQNHSRKSSLASQSQPPPAPWSQQQNGLRMPPGQQPPTPSSIHFGNVSNGPHGPHLSSSPALPTTVPLVPTPSSGPSSDLPVGSPQTSPSPAPQPAASGGPPPSLPRQGMPAFGSVTENAEHNRSIPPRPVSMPPNAPLNLNMPGPPHLRRDSSHGDGPPPSGLPHGRGMPQNPPRGRSQHQMGAGGNYAGQYSPHSNSSQFNSPGYPSNQQYRSGPNQPRSGAGGPVGSPYQTSAHMVNFSSNRGGRSPALTHSLPSTPQTNSAQLAGNPSMQPSPHLSFAQHLTPHNHQMQPLPQMYQPGYDPGFYNQPYMGYPPQPGYIAPNSPRPSYMPQPSQQGGYMPPFQNSQSPAMARTGSQTSDHHMHRVPSNMPHIPHASPLTTTTIAPPLPHPGPTPAAPNNPNSPFFKKAEKASKKIEIRDPHTGTVKTFNNLPPAQISGRSPVIVSSSPAPEPTGHGKPDIKPITKPISTKTDQEVKDEMKAAVQREIQLKKQQEEQELRLKKEEEDRKAREAEEARLRKEEDERLAKEQEQREKEEAERKAAEKAAEVAAAEAAAAEAAAAEAAAAAAAAAAAKAKADEEERIGRERDEEEAQRKKEADEAQRRRPLMKGVEQDPSQIQPAHETGGGADSRIFGELRKASSPASGTGTGTGAPIPVGADDDDETSTAIKSSKLGPSDLKDAGESSSDITKITVNAQPPIIATADTQPPPLKPNSRKPAPLNLQLKTSSEPALPSAALTALRSARFIDDINKVAYPTSIMSPNPALNSNAPNGKFKYEKDFLMQFQVVFTDKPSIDWDQRMRDTVGEPDSARPMQGSRVPSSAGTKGPRSALAGPPSSSAMRIGSFQIGSEMGKPGNILAPSVRQSSNSPFPVSGMSRPFPARNPSSTQLSSQGGSAPQSPGGHNKPPRSGSKNIPRRGMDGKRPSQGGPSKAEADSAALAATASNQTDFEPLKKSESAWKPRTAGAASTLAAASAVTASAPGAVGGPTPEDQRLSPEMVQRKVKAALNKMTPEKFDKIADQILEIASQSRYETDGRSLRQVIQLTFEKATDEPNFSSMYAKFCKRMLESMHPDIKDENIKDKNGNIVTGGALFRKYLLNRCQEEFERGWKVNLPPKPEGASEEAALLSDEYYIAAAAKRRGLGLIQFIGELFKLQMLTERIMHECVKKLVDYEGTPEEEEVESLCKLLRTIGYALDATEKSRLAMDAYFSRVQNMMDSKELNSRMKFMLLDVIELRKANWESKEADKGPKTIAEIREDAQKAQMEKEAAAARDKQRQRAQAGRGDGRSFSQGFAANQGYQDQRQNQTLGSDELRRLGVKSLRQSATGASLGPSTNLFGRSGSSGGSRKGIGSLNPTSAFPTPESGLSSRTATPPTTQRESVASTNSFSALSGHQDGADNSEAHDTTSPPSNDVSSSQEARTQATESN